MSRALMSRPTAVLLGVAALASVLAGCSDLPQGQVFATDGRAVQTFTNLPATSACHNFSIPDVTTVTDQTLADMHLYTGRNCTNFVSRGPFYLSTDTSTGPGPRIYRSFSFVGQ
ncbi:hypothetical protein [Streptacidiphilus fuscans]|uniref:Uncharacterized protein n=1 Tax=Streptacidiphilus fuscans TaxID=2789292 RepID=A0A931BAL7_9ACTN|nr:hypothetical protein [Streptacidiphilus fuscans]MBF9072091.1 hypothetical protein [Streptacidiphilus fuscans]